MRDLAKPIKVLVASVILCVGTPALAGLDQRALSQAGFHFSSDAQLPLHTPVTDAAGPTSLGAMLDGKPALLLFVDYRCRSLCGVMLDELGDVVSQVKPQLGKDYNVLTVALDEAQTREDADAFRDQHTAGTVLKTKARFLTEGRGSREAIERSLGLVAPFDSEHRQFAHPAALIVIDADGRAQQVLSPFALNPLNLTLALSGASPSAASLGTRLLHLCYGWDPVVGQYTLRIERILALLAAVTLVSLLGIICHMLSAEKKRRHRQS